MPLWTPSSLTYTPPSDPSPNLQAALQFVEARNDWFSKSDGAAAVDKMMSLFDESLEHRILPRSLKRPVLNKSQYREYVTGLLHFIREYQISLHEVIESNDSNILIHASSVGKGLSGVAFCNEYMIVLHLVPSEEPGVLPRISRVKEYVDSKVTAEFFQEERRRAKLKEEQT